jgi:hypothetical protein
LIDAAQTVNGDPPEVPAEFKDSLFHTKATLVIVPTHLMGQWPKEVKKFLGSKTKVIEIKDIGSLNKLTVGDIMHADIVIANFNLLSNDKYFSRLARFSGVDSGSLPKGKKGGRHFDAIYKECLAGVSQRIALYRDDCSAAFPAIERDALGHQSRAKEKHLRLDSKKAVYKSVSEEQAKASGSAVEDAKASTKTNMSATDIDPWNLKSAKDFKKMRCPPMEMFFWNRLVIDEFTYLREKADRARVQSVALGLKSSFRWALSATPAHETFKDIESLASLLGIHLGIDEALPGAKNASNTDDQTPASEKFSSLLEMRSVQWHEKRHTIAQSFLNRFVRQNIAEIDEIPLEEHILPICLPAAERGIYLELDTYLRSLDMQHKKALKTKKKTTSDKENRMRRILEDSHSGEEALLKRCAHFNKLSSKSSVTALETCDMIIEQRQQELLECEAELISMVATAIRQRNRILEKDRSWKGTARTEKGEVADALESFVVDVEKKRSIQGGADDEIHQRILHVLEKARVDVTEHPQKDDGTFMNKVEDGDDEEVLYGMKFSLRDYMHKVRVVGKELRGRIQSLRYFRAVRDFQLSEGKGHQCVGHDSSLCDCQASGGTVPRERLGVLSSCGHVGCLSCLESSADREACVEPSCQIHVKRTHIASAVALGADQQQAAGGGRYGAKLTSIVDKVKEVVANGDRAIVFAQFDDLKKKIGEALLDSGVKSLEVEGTVQKQIKTLDILQKETPAKDDPRVLLLTMDNESSAGVNLTTCNHAFFVHPLLADSQQQYDAYETQAIGRIRRYGQTKTVHLWRYLARDTIDMEIYEQRRGALQEF